MADLQIFTTRGERERVKHRNGSRCRVPTPKECTTSEEESDFQPFSYSTLDHIDSAVYIPISTSHCSFRHLIQWRAGRTNLPTPAIQLRFQLDRGDMHMITSV